MPDDSVHYVTNTYKFAMFRMKYRRKRTAEGGCPPPTAGNTDRCSGVHRCEKKRNGQARSVFLGELLRAVPNDSNDSAIFA